jgi:hypothetical protein
VQPDTPLFMECVDEELSEAQQEFFKKKQDEFKVCQTIFLSSFLITAFSPSENLSIVNPENCF